MPNKPYEVVNYTRDDLIGLFVKGSFNGNGHGHVPRKPQVAYLADYCSEIGVRTLVYEREYLDVHFSEDHSGYYVRCFTNYPKLCSRIHLFAEAFDDAFLTDILTGKKQLDIVQQLKYRGFMVVKPLPETVVGRTCVVPNFKTYKNAIFPTLRPYRANFFGIDLELRSLPFQEQDREVAACATSALWSVLHGTASLFQHRTLSPLEITRNALSKWPMYGRALPNDGLDVYQMAGVVRHVDLEVDLFSVREQYLLQASAYAYLRGGVPLILAIDFNLDPNKGSPELHAVALAGYELRKSAPVPISPNNFQLRATRADVLFAHDDGVGPFAALEITAKNQIITQWRDDNGALKNAFAEQLLVPLYQQIRTPFKDILAAVMELDVVLEYMGTDRGLTVLADRIEWDIFLTEVTNLKREVREDIAIAEDQKLKLLVASWPKFLWRAVGYIAADRKFDLLFDATDLLQGKQILHTISYDQKLETAVAQELKTIDYVQAVKLGLTEKILEHFKSLP